MKQAMQTIGFYGKQIMTTEVDGEHYVAMKPVCENIGLDWNSQRLKTNKHPVLSCTTMLKHGGTEDGKSRKMLMLPIKHLHGWLFTVDSNRVKLEIRDRLIVYQKECFDVLHEYWIKKAVPSSASKNTTAACHSDLHVFLEVTRGRMRISTRGNPHNTVCMATALVLQYLYNLPDRESEMRIGVRELSGELKIAAGSVRRAINRMSDWIFLIKKMKPGKRLWITLNLERIDSALDVSRNNLLANQQRAGYLPELT
jgi:hypothetical protein